MVPAHRTVEHHFYAASIAIHLLKSTFSIWIWCNLYNEDNMTDIVWEFSTINLLCETSLPLTRIEKIPPESKPQDTKLKSK